jgi:hypothetical protein
MARVLIYTCPGSGHAYPPIATAIALRDRGHDIVIRTARTSVDALQRLDLAAAPIDPLIEAIALEDWKAHTSIGALVSACETFAKRARYGSQTCRRRSRPSARISSGSTPMPRARLRWPRHPECHGAHYMPHPHPGPARGVPVFGPASPLPRHSRTLSTSTSHPPRSSGG